MTVRTGPVGTSWVDPNDIDPKLSPQKNASKLLNNKYGEGNWATGSNSEFSKIVKWIQRGIYYYLKQK